MPNDLRSLIALSAMIAVLVPSLAFAQSDSSTKKKKKKVAATARAASSNQSGGRSGAKNLNLQHAQSALPEAQQVAGPAKTRSLEAVKPPSSNSFYDGGSSKEAEYEHILDEEIKQLFKISSQSRTSANRGEIWLRLGERYVEKARLIDLREQNEYDHKLKDFAEKKTKIRPQLNTHASREYNEKAVQLYEWFVKDFPRDPKVDQALFFLGYNHFELGNTQLGERYYTTLVKRYPDSVFITESHFALGEYYFENESWKKALDNYMKVIKVKKARLNTFALYKSAWCLYRLGRTKLALNALTRVVRQSRANEREDNAPGGRKSVNKLRLAQEALKDYAPFFAEAGDVQKAESEFIRLSGNEKQAEQMLERLAFIYADKGERAKAGFVFKRLIARNPSGERASEYQYQIVLSYATHDPKEFRKELDTWLEGFGPSSQWSKDNAANTKLVSDVSKLQETTLRNYVLQQHQAVQKSHAEYSQQVTNLAYAQYFKFFSDSPKAVEMRFFHAELLFDMGKYEEAARDYSWVADKDPQGPYHEKAVVNTLLALEKDLPTVQQIDQKRAGSVEKIPLDPPVQRFEKAALRYVQAFPKGEKTSDIKRRLGVLYYGYNHFDEALELFEQILREHPKTENAEVAGNLILDIYKIRNDMDGLAKKGEEFLQNPQIANSHFGDQVRTILAKAGYLRAEKTADSGDALKAAKEFESFAATNKQSELATAARYKAAVNYEKAGDLTSATRMHGMVLMSQASDPKIKSAQNDSRNALARIYQQTGQLELAAKQYQSYAVQNPKDQKAINAYFNAGILWDSLGETNEAMHSYQAYYEQSNRTDKVEVLYAEAELLNRRDQLQKSLVYYDKYLQAGPRNEAHVIRSLYMMAHAADVQGSVARAKPWFQKVLDRFKSASKGVKDETVKYAAEARFFLDQDTLRELLAIRFGTVEKTQARAAGEVKRLREKYISEMKDVIRFDYGPFIVAALASTGKMFESLGTMFARIAVPNGYQPEDAAKYKELIQVQINGFRSEAKNSYRAAVDKASEFEVYSDWTAVAKAGLAVYEPNSVDDGEIAVEAQAVDWMGL